MQRFEKTQAALTDLATNRNMMFGVHHANQLRAGVQGKVIADVPFDPELHDPAMINPLSIWNDILGEPHVSEVIPDRPLPVNVVLHRDVEEGYESKEIVNARRFLLRGVYKALQASLPVGDDTRLYMAGYKDKALLDRRTDYLRDTEEPTAAAQAIGKLRNDGLTIVLSTFKNLPLETTKVRSRSVVGIKANHTYDLALGRNVGDWDTGERPFGLINTNDRQAKPNLSLARYWEVQQKRHEDILLEKEAAGIHMAQAIFDKENLPYPYFDTKAVDQSLASAISQTVSR